MHNITYEMITEAFDSILDSNDPGAEALAKLAYQLLEDNTKLWTGFEIYKRERERYMYTKPELNGRFFLSGGLGDIDLNGLPEQVRIVPAYGCAWEQLYVKSDETISYEGS